MHPKILATYGASMKSAEVMMKMAESCLNFLVIQAFSYIQTKVERLILNFVVNTMQPISIVNEEDSKSW